MATPATIYSISGDDDYGLYFGGPCNITWQAIETLYYKLKFNYAGWTKYSDALHPTFNDGDSGSYTYHYTLPLDVLYHVTDSTTAKITVTLFTFTDSACTQSVAPAFSTEFVAHLRDIDVFPTMKSLSVSVVNLESNISTWTCAVAGFSKLNIYATAEGAYGSSIASFSISGDVAAYVPRAMLYDGVMDYYSTVITSPGQKTIRVTCTDTRGHSSTVMVDKSIIFYDYSPPKITSLSASRNGSGSIDVTGSWTYDTVGGNSWSLGIILYKPSTATDWTEYNYPLNNGVTTTIPDLMVKNNTSYNIKLVVYDGALNKDEMETFVSTSSVILDFMTGGYGFGVGKICEQEGMEVSMETTFFGPVNIGSRHQRLEDYIHSVVNELSVRDIVDIIYPVGSIYITTAFPENSTPAAIFGGSWVQIKDRFILAAGDDYPGLSVGGESSHILLEREMPRHRHYGCTRTYYDALENPGTHPYASQPAEDNAKITTLFSNFTGGAKDGVAGSCAAHNNMPPYLAAFIWQRVA